LYPFAWLSSVDANAVHGLTADFCPGFLNVYHIKRSEIMSAINFYQEVNKLKDSGSPGTSNLVEADCFSLDVRVFSDKHQPRPHTCSQDEFTYVLNGEVEMQVGNDITRLKAGEGILVKAGERHDTRPCEGASWLLIAKQPHKHHYFKNGEF
jgi:quercetin dioxygenase-like cupin family protein